MTIYNARLNRNYSREDVIQHIIQKKSEGVFTVVDVGGSAGGWSAPYIDALIDFQKSTNYNIFQFAFDITHPDGWKEVLDYVEKNGKFDFCLCTHTLEDIMNPGFVCEQISKIAKEGYIAVPSKYIELSRCEGPYRGFIHHRWIFVVRNGEFIGYPKLNHIEHMDVDPNFLNKKEYNDLAFFWKDNIQVSYLNNNYMGPDVRSVIGYFRTLLERDDTD